MTWLVVQDETPPTARKLPPDTVRVSIGRALDNDLVITDVSASREHCRLERDADGTWWVVDLDSRNGTRRNGEKITRARLDPKDRVEIGNAKITLAGAGRAGHDLALELTGQGDAGDLAKDPLTHLASAPAAIAELRRALDAPRPRALVLKLDVDYLGLINDMFGLRIGDDVIRRVAETLADAAEADPRAWVVSREAGGKFLAVAPHDPHDSRDAARVLGETTRERLAQTEWPGALRQAQITCSVGYAHAPDHATRWDDLLRRAESALAAAKRQGRDQTACYEPNSPRITGQRSGLWAAAGLWDPLRARAEPRDPRDPPRPPTETPASTMIAPLTLTPRGQSILALVAQALGSDLSLDSMLDAALGILTDATRARRGYLLLHDASGTPRLRAALDRERPGEAPTERLSQRIVRTVLDRRAALLIDDAQSEPHLQGSNSVALGHLRSLIAAPIVWEDQLVGLVYVDHPDVLARFTPEDRDLVLAFARLIAGPARRAAADAVINSELQRTRAALAHAVRGRAERYPEIIGRSPAITDLLRTLDRVAQAHIPVLIHGESGTGKELVARAIHANSPRKDAPFIAENCAALSDDILESELFGYVQGAFTGANEDRCGLIEAAHGGTLFLDELGETSPKFQAKLLRVLQERELRPVGATTPRSVDVRIIAATHRDLRQLVQSGAFREDLYYRLAVMTLDLPPLRDRREDIPTLTRHFLDLEARHHHRPPPDITPDALQLLTHHDWPGNVRELHNEVRKLLALAPPTIEPQHLSPKLVSGSPHTAPRRAAVAEAADALLHMVQDDQPLAQVIEACEAEVIRRTLRAAFDNRSETARRLGLSRPGLHKKMKRYGIDGPA